ncbi:MAG: hypothetical protein ACI9FN_003270 [Saprospiraceae bacterium]|jgi:hypothetical protein
MTKFNLAILFVIVIVILESCFNTTPDVILELSNQLPDEVDYNFHIKPILSDRCYKCHGPDANSREGKLRLDIADESTKESLSDLANGRYILRAKSRNKSELYHRIVSTDEEYMMPPPESNLNLSPLEKALIAKWIDQGAKYKKHWSFVSPVLPDIPSISDDWLANDIDHFILEKILKNDFTPATQASKATLLRRASMDITGLPPSPKEVTSFINDDSPNAYDLLIDKLLSSPHYGERMALEWLDVARYADTHGYQDDGMRTTWPWRDWLIKAYNDNLPYDQFVTWQLAGDLLDKPSKDQLLATCFNRHHPQSQEGGVVDEEYRVEYVADRANTFGKAFLGLTTECARCHDHKYDPISQENYYQLFAYFNNNNESGIVPYNGEASPTVFLPTEKAKRQLDSLKIIVDSLEIQLVSEKYIDDFTKWYDGLDDTISVNYDYKLIADFSFEKEVKASQRTMNLDRDLASQRAKLTGEVTSFINLAKKRADAAPFGDVDRRPQLVEGIQGKGLSFIGDAGIRFNRDLDIDRNQPFSVSIWVKPLVDNLEGPIFNNSNDAFEGYRGWLCKLNKDRTLSFQLNHVWPDNAIDIITHDKLPINEWTHIVMTYDGRSKADGVGIFINGKTPKYSILADKLYKSLLHGRFNTNWSDHPFILGKGMTKSMEDMVMDELKIYKRQLSEQEVMALTGDLPHYIKSDYKKDNLLPHFLLSGYSQDYNSVNDQIIAFRAIENQIATDEIEVMIMHERKENRPTYILDRGMYDQPGKEVNPGIPGALSIIEGEQPANRLELAEWLFHPDHPLTARVAVNRVWKMLFGRGIVATQGDFGSQGNLPSHPELLDFLAIKLIDLDWDIKAFIKYVMLSSVYTQSSIGSDEAKAEDPENMLYSYFPAHRLSAELIRDNALAASGLMVKTIGGPSVYPYQPPGLWKALATRNATVYNQQHGDSLYRRSMYTVWKRSSPPPSMMTFDAPDRYYCVVDRQKTATPLQSLILLNDIQFLEAAKVLAEKMMLQSEYDPIEFAFTSLIGRYPSQVEKALLKEQYAKGSDELSNDKESTMAWLSSGEYQVDPSLNKTALAVNTMIVSTIMNFDEFVMKR